MAMNYYSRHRASGMAKAGVLAVVLALTGCAGQLSALKIAVQPQSKAVTAKRGQMPIKETARYLPRQAYDRSGAKIPYQPTVNPYIEQHRVVNTQSVTRFIQARRAYKAGDLTNAELALKKLTSSDSTLAGPWVLRGHIARSKGQLETAIEFYRRAIHINKYNVNAYIGLAKAQRQTGLFRDAQHTYANVLDIWRDFPEAHLNLAILYDLYLNMPTEAQMHLEAYEFLSFGKHKQANEWLAEIRQRTGIQTSFIDGGSADSSSLLGSLFTQGQ